MLVRSKFASEGLKDCTMSKMGPNGRGVVSGSFPPTKLFTSELDWCKNALTKLVFPIPASPWIRAIDPFPSPASAISAARALSSFSRSTSRSEVEGLRDFFGPGILSGVGVVSLLSINILKILNNSNRSGDGIIAR